MQPSQVLKRARSFITSLFNLNKIYTENKQGND